MNNVLSIDIGSTRARAAVVDIDGLLCLNRIDFYNSELDSCLIPAIKNMASMTAGIRKANVTSCVKKLAVRAEGLCAGTGLFDEINIVRAHEKLPISINYDKPQTLGTDRLCAALACAALFSGRDCIIIDAGTAVTVDCLRGGRTLECGMILPGLTTQFESLHDKTDALPLVSVEKFKELSLPSKSTEECIKAGVLYGTSGAVANCVNLLLSNNDNDDEIATCVNQLLRDDTIIIATGGDWETIKPFITYDITTIPDLTLIGAAIYPAPD